MSRKVFSILISLCLLFQQAGFASVATELNLAGHLARMSGGFTPDRFRPVHIRFFSYDALNDNIKVMLDKGDAKGIKQNQLNESTQELLNYFLIGVNLPNDTFWVNLRPDSEDNIIDPWLARTDVGRIMLEADLQLKKDTAQFTSPQTPEGRAYWNKLYQKAEELYGYQEVSIPTLTRPWIVPNEIIVRETKDSAYIYKATLKVMLEQDYLKGSVEYSFKDSRAKALNEYSSQLIRELIIPKLTKEVNLSKRYAALRQVYYSIILSRWFKSRFTNQTGQYASRIDTKDLNGLTSKSAWSKTPFFTAYKKSFAQGEYNIKEPVYTPTGQVIRSYFSGGEDFSTMTINGARVADSPFIRVLSRANLSEPGITPQPEVTSSPLAANKNFELLINVPEAMKALADRDLTGQRVLIRVNMNVKSNEEGEIDNPARLEAIKEIVNFVLSRGGTPILIAHNGRLDTKKNVDDRQSLRVAAKYMQEHVFPDVFVIFHENSITKDGVQIKKDGTVLGAVNILENLRFADDYEVGAKRMIFAKSLIGLSDGIYIFDAAGDFNSSGASVEQVPFVAQEVYLGPHMVKEFSTLKKNMEKGYDVIVMGSGVKAEEKIALLPHLIKILRPGGRILIGSGPSPTLNDKQKDFLEQLRSGDPERVITALDYSDERKLDIGPITTGKFREILKALKPGQRVLDNGTMGLMEGEGGKYQAGTKATNEKLIEAAKRGVEIDIIGGDGSSAAKRYGLDQEPNTTNFTSGGVALNIIANQPLAGLKAFDRRQKQLELEKTEPGEPRKFNIAINGARGRMGKLYLHNLFYNEKFSSQMRVVALNGIPLDDINDFIARLTSPDSTYGMLFPGATVKVIEINKAKQYAIIEINNEKVLLLNDRKDAIRWDLAGDVFGEQYLTRLGIIETSGQNLESAKAMKMHISAVGDGMVLFGAPPKDEGTPIVVLGVNEGELTKDAQIISNASCTTNDIAPVAKVVHDKYGIKRGIILTDHAETSDQAATDTFRGDEPARARPGHRIQSPAKTGAAKLLGKLIPGIGPNDGKAIRVGTLTSSVVLYTAELANPTTVEELRDLYIQASKDKPSIIGVGNNLSSKDIVKDPHSATVDLALIKASKDGKRVLIPSWYDNEWGYDVRGLDALLATLIMQERGERTREFPAPAKPAKEVKEAKAVPASEIEGLSTEGALPVFTALQRQAVPGRRTDIYLTGMKEKQTSRYGQIILRMLMGDSRFNLKAITVDGITKEDFDTVMKAFAQSIIYSADLGNVEGVKISPLLTDKGDMFLVFEAAGAKRLVRVLPSLPAELEPSAKVVDITKIKYSYAEMIDSVSNSLRPLNAELASAVISMSTRPGGELLDSGKGTSVPANIIPTKIPELENKDMLYLAYQVPVNSGSYLFATFSMKELVSKGDVDKLIKTIPGIGIEDNTSSHFAANRTNIIYDRSQTLVVQDKKEQVTMVSLFFLVNEELNAANKALEALESTLASQPKVTQASSAITRPITVGYDKGIELQKDIDEAKKIIDDGFEKKKTAFVIAGHGARDIEKQVEEYNLWRQKVRDIRSLTVREKQALVRALSNAKATLLTTATPDILKETRFVVLLDDEAMNLDEKGELILRGNLALVSDTSGPSHKAIFAHAGKHRYDEFFGSELEKQGKTPQSIYFPLSQLDAMRRNNMLDSLRLIIGHDEKDFKVGHIDESSEVNQKIERDLMKIFGNYLDRQKARFEMDWLPQGAKVTVSTISFSVGGWAGQDAVHPYVKEAVEEALIEAVETRQIRSYGISLVGPYINTIITHLNGGGNASTEELAQKIYAKAEEVAKELNLSPLVKRKLANGDYNKPYMITEMEVSERKSEPLLIFTSNAVPGSFNPWGLEMFTNPNTTYGLVIDKNMMGSFSFGIRDTQTGKKVRLNFAEGQQRMFTLALAGTQPFRYINTEVFPNKAPTLPKDLSPDEPVAVASYITMPNKEQISVLMVRSQSGLPAVGEGIEPAGYAYPVAIGAGYYRGLFPAKQKDSATTGLSAKVTALGFQLAHGYLQKPRDVFDDKSFDPSRADALKKSEMLAKMGVIEPGAISVEPEDLLKALEGRWFELPKAGDIYQSKPSKTGKPKITVSLIKADVGGWVGHTDVNPDILKAARDTLRWAMGEISTIFSKKKNLRQLFVKAIEMETRRAQDLNPDVSAKAKKELENIEAAISFIEANPGLLGDIYVTDGGDDLELLMLHRNGVNNGKIHTLALHTLYLCGKLAEYHKQYNFLQDLIVDVSKHTGTVQGMGPGVAELDMEEEDGKAFVAAMLMDKTSAAAFSKFIPEAFTNFYHAATLQGPENVRYRGYILELWNVKTHRGIYLDMQTEMHIVNALLSETEGRWQKRIYPVQKEYWSLKEGIILVDKDGHKLTLADVKEDDPIFVASTEKLFAIGGDKYKGKDDPVGLLVEEAAMPYSLEAVPGKTVPGGLRGSTDAPLMPVATKDAHPTRLDQPPRIVALGFNIANGQFSKPLDYFEDPRFDRAREEAMNIYGALRPLGPRPPSLTLHPEYTSVPEVLKEMDKLQLWQPATAASSALTKKTGGIDFRNKAMTINYEPMGNFSQLNFNLPKLSAKALASFDVEQEFAQVENMVERGLLPSGERIKELLAACSQKGELESRQERIMVLLVKMGMLEEENCCTQEASKEFKEALVLAESLS